MSLKIIRNDITKMAADAIVNTANEESTMIMDIETILSGFEPVLEYLGKHTAYIRQIYTTTKGLQLKDFEEDDLDDDDEYDYDYEEEIDDALDSIGYTRDDLEFMDEDERAEILEEDRSCDACSISYGTSSAAFNVPPHQ